MRYPRVLGAFLAIVGGALLYITLDGLQDGVKAVPKAAILGPGSMLVGLWCLLFGCPLRSDGTPPEWWRLGFYSCIGLSVLVSILLLF